MSSAGDPATLYAASAAAAGALVAIIGGFLISRVVGLLAQKETLQLRQRELAQRLGLSSESLDAIHHERLAVSTDWFDQQHLNTIVEERGQVDVEAITGDSNFVGTTREEMRQVVERRAGQVQDAFAHIEAAAPTGAINDLSELDLSIPGGEEDIWEAVALAITRSRQPPRANPLWLAQPSVMVPVMPTPEIVYRRQDERIKDERQARAQVAALTAEVNLVDEELIRLGRGLPRLLMSIGILSYFALGSVALPLFLLARNEVTDSAFPRWGVWGLFVSGLCLIIGFLIWSAWPLRHSTSAQQE